MIKAAGYIRVSTPTQAKEGESLKTQEQAIRKYCEINDYELTAIYADRGISGASVKERPDFMRLKKDARAKKFECLIIYRLSRFGRNARDILNSVNELKENGVILMSIKDKIDMDTSLGQATLTIFAAFAQLERDIINEQMRENKIFKWKNKQTFVGKTPFGYKWNKEKKVIEVVPKEAEIVKKIVSMYVDKGMSYMDIIIKLREDGIKCKRSLFTSSTISYLLNNPAYYGNYQLNQYKYEGSRRTNEKKAEKEFISFPIPPIISKLDWDRIQKRREFNKVKGKRITVSEEYWLRDLLQCGECGGKIKPHHGSVRKDGTFLRYYACHWSNTTDKELKSHGRDRCGLVLIKAEAIEEEVWFNLISKISITTGFVNGKRQPVNLGIFKKNKGYIIKMEEYEAVINNQEDNLKNKKMAQQRLNNCLEDVYFSKDIFYEKHRILEDEILTIEADIKELKEKLYALRDSIETSKEIEDLVANNSEWLHRVQESLYNLSLKDKKLFVESSVGRIRVFNADDDGDGHWSIGVSGSFNRAIFERLISEGKIEPISSKWFRPTGCASTPSKKPTPRATAPAAAANLRSSSQ